DSELMSGGWTQLDLKARGKGAEFKVQLALKLRAETTVTVAWIAERLHMGTRGSLCDRKSQQVGTCSTTSPTKPVGTCSTTSPNETRKRSTASPLKGNGLSASWLPVAARRNGSARSPGCCRQHFPAEFLETSRSFHNTKQMFYE